MVGVAGEEDLIQDLMSTMDPGHTMVSMDLGGQSITVTIAITMETTHMTMATTLITMETTHMTMVTTPITMETTHIAMATTPITMATHSTHTTGQDSAHTGAHNHIEAHTDKI